MNFALFIGLFVAIFAMAFATPAANPEPQPAPVADPQFGNLLKSLLLNLNNFPFSLSLNRWIRRIWRTWSRSRYVVLKFN